MIRLIHGDAQQVLEKLPDNSIDLCVTSPPYFGARSYLDDDNPLKELEIGYSEDTPEDYIQRMTDISREIYRVLKPTGSFFLNIGDSYSGGSSTGNIYKNLSGKYGSLDISRFGKKSEIDLHKLGYKKKSFLLVPERLIIRLVDEVGFILRNKIIWFKPNARPDSVKSRFSTRWEYMYYMAKTEKNYFDLESVKIPASEDTVSRYIRDLKNIFQKGTSRYVPDKIREHSRVITRHKQVTLDGSEIPILDIEVDLPDDLDIKRNPGDVWIIPTVKGAGYHIAPFPKMLVKIPILSACPPNGVVLDPFAGSGTVGHVCIEMGRKCILIELNKEYVEYMSREFNVKYISQDDITGIKMNWNGGITVGQPEGEKS